MTSVVGGVKFGRAAKVMLQLLAVPHGSAECESIFSTVKRTRTEFRFSLFSKALGNLFMVNSRQTRQYFELMYSVKFLKLEKFVSAR